MEDARVVLEDSSLSDIVWVRVVITGSLSHWVWCWLVTVYPFGTVDYSLSYRGVIIACRSLGRTYMYMWVYEFPVVVHGRCPPDKP